MKALTYLVSHLKVKHFISIQRRSFCDQKPNEIPVKKYVYISQSTDIYTNLALEDWMYANNDFSNQELLMLWKNKPCVVIGRHQNPWLEANVDKLGSITTDGVKLARRNSGGGTVYHDEGNLNVTFFTTNQNYNRKHNLQIITRALFREHNLKIEISERLDLVVRNYKVSGTASKLSRKNAYHHCTLLINANKDHLHQALCKPNEKIKTRATQSIRSSILNLKEENPNVSVDSVLKAVGHEFLHSPLSHPPKGKPRNKPIIVDNGFQLVNPTEVWFPGITKIKENLQSQDWIFGKCPEFSIERELQIVDNHEQFRLFNMEIFFEKGSVSAVKLLQHDLVLENLKQVEEKISNRFQGCQYSGTVAEEIRRTATKIISDNYAGYGHQAIYT